MDPLKPVKDQIFQNPCLGWLAYFLFVHNLNVDNSLLAIVGTHRSTSNIIEIGIHVEHI
jgi:hypothetical protein